MNNLREERTFLIEDQRINRARVLELEQSLNDDRSKRLKDMHLAELFRTRTADLEARVLAAEKDKISAESALLEKLQRLETVVSLNESQKMVITSQGGKIFLYSPTIICPNSIAHNPTKFQYSSLFIAFGFPLHKPY